MSNNTSIFTEDETELLELTKTVRKNVIASMTKKGVPEKTNELRVLNEYLNSIDDTVQRSVANRLKHDENGNKGAILEAVTATLFKINTNNKPISDKQLNAPEEYIDVDIVPGEMDIAPDRLQASDYIDDLDAAE